METSEPVEKKPFMLSQKGKRITIALVVVVLVLLLVRNVSQLQFSKFEGYWVGNDANVEIEKNGTVKVTPTQLNYDSYGYPMKESVVGKLESGKKVENTVKPVWQHIQIEISNWEESKRDLIQSESEFSSEDKIQLMNAKNLKELQDAMVNWARRKRLQSVEDFIVTVFSTMTLENDVLTLKLTDEMLAKVGDAEDISIRRMKRYLDVDVYFYLVDDDTLLIVNESAGGEEYLNKSHKSNQP